MRRISITLLIALTCGTASLHADAELLLEARNWSADLSGGIRFEDNELLPLIDLDEDLGLEADESFEGRLVFRPSRRTMVRAAWAPLNYTGTRVFHRTIVFVGRTFKIDTKVESELELEYGRVGFAWQFISAGRSRFRIGPLIEAKGFRGTATLSTPDFLFITAPQQEEFETALPSAGLILDAEPTDQLHIFAEASVLVDTAEGDLLDAEAGIRYYPIDRLGITAGYRRLEVDAEHEGDLLELDIEGLFFGVALRF